MRVAIAFAELFKRLRPVLGFDESGLPASSISEMNVARSEWKLARLFPRFRTPQDRNARPMAFVGLRHALSGYGLAARRKKAEKNPDPLSNPFVIQSLPVPTRCVPG